MTTYTCEFHSQPYQLDSRCPYCAEEDKIVCTPEHPCCNVGEIITPDTPSTDYHGLRLELIDGKVFDHCFDDWTDTCPGCGSEIRVTP